MHLQHIRAQNFRAFGDGTSVPVLDWRLNPGMNILIGENDAGKSAIIDAIRLLLWTTSFENVRLQEQDFHVCGASRANTLVLEATLRDLSPSQEAAVLEWLTYEADGSRSLVLNLQAKRQPPQPGRRARIDAITRSGRNGTGPEIGAAVRDLVRATYLRPLRDAEAELRPGRQSRLSQILGAHELMAGQDKSDFDPANPMVLATTLVGMMNQAQHQIGGHQAIGAVQTDINDNYLSRMSFAGDALASQVRIIGDASLTQILERFELSLLPPKSVHANERCPRGLGYNNALFMATELVLLRTGDELALLLIEEPEAHLHPQLQERVVELIQEPPLVNQRPVQVVMSTHSPSLAAGAAIDSMTLVHAGRTYSLRPEETKLARTDYEYLRRFIDATKSNLFFARGVAIVEGPAEALLLPAIAEVAGLSFSKYGVSIVNVGDVGLYHYARIFQRAAAAEAIPVPVACITDRDIVPDIATYVTKPKNGKPRFESDYTPAAAALAVTRKVDRVEAADDPAVKVFVSDQWTLEYDLATTGLAELMFIACALGQTEHSKGERLAEADEKLVLASAQAAWPGLKAKHPVATELAAVIYQPLYEKDASKAVTAQYAAKLIRTGNYGTGDALLQALPLYLKHALRHLTGTMDPAPAVAKAAA
ncbi:MAG: AAA family ATPase [Burkholderiales bacterium]|nr:AAA family ATPase [Burkholderiales bacterium]